MNRKFTSLLVLVIVLASTLASVTILRKTLKEIKNENVFIGEKKR